MNRKTERICYIFLLVTLVGFLAYDWYERIFVPSREKLQIQTSTLRAPDESLTGRSTNPDKLIDSQTNQSPADQNLPSPLFEWPLDVQDEFGESAVLEENFSSDPEDAWMYENSVSPNNEKMSEREIDAFYDKLARRKSSPASHRRVVDWEATGGEKPDWVVMQEWRNRVHLENYLNPGPIYTSSYTDVYGNRHRSFEDRSGRIDVFNTWGREYIYQQPK